MGFTSGHACRGHGVTTAYEKTEFSPTELMERIRCGDREALAEAIHRYRPLIERQIRQRLRGSLRKLFDTGDVLGTVTRKLDRALKSGDLQLNDNGHLGALLVRMVRQAVVDKHRLLRRIQSVEAPDSAWAHRFLGKSGLKPADSDVNELLEEAFAALPDLRDRRILAMWLHGLNHSEIGERLDLTAQTTRKRWSRIRSLLRERFEKAQP